MISVAEAATITSLSIFLSDEVRTAPLMIGLFFAGRAAAEILADLAVGIISDNFRERRKLLAICAAAASAGSLCYMSSRDYLVLVSLGSFLFGVGGLAVSQLFAYTREFAASRRHDVTFFNSALRSVGSAAWIVGPLGGFLALGRFGFTALYAGCAVLFCTAAILCRWGLPNVTATAAPAASTRDVLKRVDTRSKLLLGTIALLMVTNMAYQVNISLFLTKDLGLPATFTGVVLGASAALEVGLMLVFGAYANRIGRWRLVLLSTVCATVFFVSLPLATTPAAVLLLQILNAGWTAVILSIPVVILQDRMPSRPGTASALYAGAYKSGMLLGSGVAGVGAGLAGFTNLFWMCAACTLVAAVLMIIGTTVEEQP